MTTQEPRSTETSGNSTDTARRAFLAKCGKLAVITPPAVTLLLSAASRNYAVAGSGFGGRHHRGDRHDGDRHRGRRRHAKYGGKFKDKN